ncbi:PREDICTED: clock-controlled protein 8-like [Dinoponera quadriceps]|uniref:Clock-controlled protein 8-like n=1 Tax=Dinoponera quadriceps TaxID=609295 RepID=A0A6P3XPT4_DINQU|nr:PREDICTED: clock-controlled protein 8-like [Dinoponera quadriceps]XP_014480520.1 PREDICTED: clock-controlled protein 8-like [Dinoponera quadriceps]XP_014480521.1 PREDICTED: clock-controlled protein 8-like [Dinoponera quadriceps]
MYAAAGGASIANRRKQKRLQLNKQGAATPVINVVPPRLKGALGSRQQQYHHHQHQHHQHQHQFHHHHHHYQHPTKHQIRSYQDIPPRAQQQQAPTSTSSSSAAFHPGSVDDRRRHHHHADHHKSSQQQVAPLSPIQFPISPPPLSLESSVSVTTCPNNKASNFPFPPPSILDLRVSPPTSEPQCGGQGPGGKAAWQGCNRPSLPLSPASPGYRGDGYKTKQCEAHRRWMKRNRIRDASYCYGSSGEDDEEDDSSNAIRRRGEVSAAVNTVLYAGLGTTALGLIISFVGTGEKGFLSPELRLVGPSLLCAGLLCCLFRILLCLCLCRCGPCRWRFCQVATRKKEKARKAEARPTGTLSTASLLPPSQQQRHYQQNRQPATPTSRSVSPATKGHELLLSPAQLPE